MNFMIIDMNMQNWTNNLHKINHLVSNKTQV